MGSFPYDRRMKVLSDTDAKVREERESAAQALSGLPAPQPVQAPPVAPSYPILRDSITGRT
jgi:hypothetical protein